MTYSNTNKDKTQSERWQRAKQILFYVILGYIIYSSLINIYRQFITLKAARNRVDTLERRVNELEIEKKKYQRLVEESTSSATISRNQRQYFGVGTENDRWIALPSITKEERITSEVNEVETEPNLIKWWKLFTKGLL
ncbi:MAG: hypothetical protein WC851_00150 [Candidatus Shapirobacteria bacterium]|jgi:hypothetical protein